MNSNCCGADIIEDTDVCSKCKNHCVGKTDWLEEIQAERERQVLKGYTAEHDDEHTDGFIAEQAVYYAEVGYMAMSLDKKRDYFVKGGALLVAELERLERLDSNKHVQSIDPFGMMKKSRN